MMEINDELRELILVGASALELKKKALELGMITLRRSGLQQGRGRADDHGRSFARNGSVIGGENGRHHIERTLEENDRVGRAAILHLSTNSAPRVRVHGKLRPLGHATSHGGRYEGSCL